MTNAHTFQVPISREDLAIAPKGSEIKHDEDVERVRRYDFVISVKVVNNPDKLSLIIL